MQKLLKECLRAVEILAEVNHAYNGLVESISRELLKFEVDLIDKIRGDLHDAQARAEFLQKKLAVFNCCGQSEEVKVKTCCSSAKGSVNLTTVGIRTKYTETED